MKLEIKDNNYTGGRYAIFEHDGKWYYADKSPIPYLGMEETMIFPYDKENEEVSDWGGLYCDRTDQSLEECVEEFINGDYFED